MLSDQGQRFSSSSSDIFLLGLISKRCCRYQYGLNPYWYIMYLLKSRPYEGMTDEELDLLAPWNESVKEACDNLARLNEE